jgi:hypothetical protein
MQTLLVLAVIALFAGCGKKAADSSTSATTASDSGGIHVGPGAESIPGKAIEKAESTACQAQIKQVRDSIRMDIDSTGKPPASLDQGATASISKCPVSGQPYVYDPTTGSVHCSTPGHEKF